jgi:hypothetical protein
MPKRKIKWQAGDNFLIPLKDGSFGQGQVLSYEAQAVNSALCAFSWKRFVEMPKQVDGISEESLIAIQFVTRESLDRGNWPLIGHGPVIGLEGVIGINARRSKGFVGTKIIGSGIAVDFLSAFHRLIPWNDYHDPEYLDKLLISPDRKPTDVLLKPA